MGHKNLAYDQETLAILKRAVKTALEGAEFRIKNNHQNVPQFLEDLKDFEQSTGEQGQELIKSIILNDQSEKTKEDLLAALERLEKGTYGFCQKPGCGKVIPIGRILSIPQAKYCLLCQVETAKSKGIVITSRKKRS